MRRPRMEWDAWPVDEAPADFEARVLARLDGAAAGDEPGATDPAPRAATRRRRRLRVIAPLAAMLALAAALLVWLSRRPAPPSFGAHSPTSARSGERVAVNREPAPGKARPAAAPTEPPAPAPAPLADDEATRVRTLQAHDRIQWPIADGWDSNRFTMPLSFAPELPWQGVEWLQFAPGFLDRRFSGWWSYLAALTFDNKPALDRASLERALTTYYTGLCMDPIHNGRGALLRAQKRSSAILGGSGDHLRGQVHTFDCFHDDRVPVTLNVEISLAPCARSERRRLLLVVSPRPRGDPVWEALAERRDAFHCD